MSLKFKGSHDFILESSSINFPLSAELFPGIMMSGSSPAGAAAAAEVGAIAVKYPERVGDEPMIASELAGPSGVRIGIITRNTTAEAWQVAHERFPADRRGQMLHRLAMQVSDSCWHQQLSKMANESAAKDNPNWLGPFENYRTFCPYLVGSYERVAQELATHAASNSAARLNCAASSAGDPCAPAVALAARRARPCWRVAS